MMGSNFIAETDDTVPKATVFDEDITSSGIIFARHPRKGIVIDEIGECNIRVKPFFDLILSKDGRKAMSRDFEKFPTVLRKFLHFVAEPPKDELFLKIEFNSGNALIILSREEHRRHGSERGINFFFEGNRRADGFRVSDFMVIGFKNETHGEITTGTSADGQ